MSRPVQLGIVGASGFVSRCVLPSLHKTNSIRLAAICSRNLEKARLLAQPFGAEGFESFESMILQPGLDAVYIATPVHTHLELATVAARAGKAVLLEKPMTRNTTEADQLRAVIQETGAVMMEGYMMNFHPAHEWLRSELSKKRFGEILSVRARFGCWYPPIENAWRQKRELGGGGCLMDMGSHLISLMQWLFGPLEFQFGKSSRRIFQYEVEDTALVVAQDRTGANIVMESFFSLPPHTPATLDLCGSLGWARLTGTIGQGSPGSATFLVPSEKTQEVHMQFDAVDLYHLQFESFAIAIRRGTSPEFNNVLDGRRIMQIIENVYLSASSM